MGKAHYHRPETPATLTAGVTIGVLARVAGVNVETVRYYQRRGLITQPERPLGSVRRYTQEHLARLHFIRSAQRLGFSLTEITQMLRLEDGTNCQEAAALAGQHLKDVRTRLTDLTHIERVLSELVAACRQNTNHPAPGCPLIDALQYQSGVDSGADCKD